MTGAADVVIRVKDPAGRTVLAVIVEVQLNRDPEKEWSWPKYWALCRDRERAPAMVLVIADDDATARWADGMLRTGDPHAWHPYVTTLGALPRITDRDEVRRHPVRATLAALGHTDDAEVVLAFVDGLQGSSLPEKEVAYILDAVLSRASASLLEVIMHDQKREYVSEFARKYYGQGKAEGRIEGEEEGRRKAARQHVRAILAERGIPLAEDQERRLDACTDLETLDRWLTRAVKARSASDVLIDG